MYILHILVNIWAYNSNHVYFPKSEINNFISYVKGICRKTLKDGLFPWQLIASVKKSFLSFKSLSGLNFFFLYLYTQSLLIYTKLTCLNMLCLQSASITDFYELSMIISPVRFLTIYLLTLTANVCQVPREGA